MGGLFQRSRSCIGEVGAEPDATNSGPSLPARLTALGTFRRVRLGHSPGSIRARRSGLWPSSLSQCPQSSGSRMTGIRWWTGAISELGSVVMIAAPRCRCSV